MEEETSPLYHSVDAISLTTYKGRKVGRNTGNGARRKNKERRMVERRKLHAKLPHLPLPQ